jgi:hypothetical protein
MAYGTTYETKLGPKKDIHKEISILVDLEITNVRKLSSLTM